MIITNLADAVDGSSGDHQKPDFTDEDYERYMIELRPYQDKLERGKPLSGAETEKLLYLQKDLWLYNPSSVTKSRMNGIIGNIQSTDNNRRLSIYYNRYTQNINALEKGLQKI